MIIVELEVLGEDLGNVFKRYRYWIIGYLLFIRGKIEFYN